MAPKPNKLEASAEPPTAERRSRRRSRLRPLLLVLLTAAGVGFWFAPRIIARTPLRQRIVPALVPGYPAAITTGSASLDWFSPVELRDVVFADLSGEALLSVPMIRSERTLIDILLDSRNAGMIHLEPPKSRIVVRADGSNLEDVVRPVLAAQSEPSARGFTIASDGGDLELVDDAQGRRTRVNSLALSFTKPSDGNGAWQFSCAGSIDRPGLPGTFRLEGSLGPARDESLNPSAESAEESVRGPVSGVAAHAAVFEARVRADGLVLDEFQAAVARLWPTVRCNGVLDAEVELKGSLSSIVELVALTAEGRIASRELSLSADGVGGMQRWKVRDLVAGGRAELADGTIRLDDVRIKSDLARLSANGAFGVGGSRRALAGGNSAVTATNASGDTPESNVLSAIDMGNCHVEGEVDLTKLAQVFPGLVRVREGTELTGGTLRVNLDGKSADGGQAWNGSVEARGIAAIASGRSITWEQPVLVKFQGHDSADGPVLEQLDCKSDFVTASGRGSLADATISVGCDLDRLAKELGRFLDLEDWQMAGKLLLNVACRRDERPGIATNGELSIEKFALGVPGQRSWSEQRLTARFGTSIATREGRFETLESATLLLTSGPDRLDVRLMQPVPWRMESGGTEAPFQVEMSGDLETWRARIQPFGFAPDWDLRGQIQMTTCVVVASDALAWSDTSVSIDRLHAWGRGLYVSDPHVELRTSGRWDRSQRRLTLPKTTWASNSLSLRADEIVIEQAGIPGNPGSVSGTIVFRSGVEQLSKWLRDPNVLPTRSAQGLVSGRVQLTHANDVTEGNLSLQVDDLIAYQPTVNRAAATWEEAWREKQVILQGKGRYDHGQDSLEIARITLASDAAKFNVRGAIGELTTQPSVDLAGEVSYDWQNIIARLRPWLGEDVQITGRQDKTFALRGPRAIASARLLQTTMPTGLSISKDAHGSVDQPSGLSGEAGLGWESAKIYGLELGAVELQARLSGTTLNFSPLDVAVSEGRIKLSPRIELLRDPKLLVCEPGHVVENVRLSPEMCRNWMKFVAPLMADATQAEGRFSLDLTAAELPLRDPKMGEVVGTLAIHQGDVSPGPMAQQVIQVAQQVRQILNRRFPTTAASPTGSWIRIPEQNVEFHMTEGRVHHRLMEFQVGDVTIRTEGSVGFDETLALVAAVPVREEWVQSDKLLGGLKGQTLRIPITGTLKRPQVDSRALNGLARQAGTSAAGQLLKEGLGNQLDRLFSPKK